MTAKLIPLSIGIYSQADAARLLGMNPSRLRRWVNGYTYWLRHRDAESRRAKPPVITKSDLPILDGRVALSFLELMELRIVKALVDNKGISLQEVRKSAATARDVFNTPHPFASRRVFTERKRIYASVTPDAESEVLEMRRGRAVQVVLGDLIPMLEEVDFDEESSLVSIWWPLGKSEPVVLNPRIQFGAPVMAGTRVRTTVAAEMARRTSVEIAADNLGLADRQVRASVQFEQLLAAA
jgi:uncharacterized protein (DUF433 family)